MNQIIKLLIELGPLLFFSMLIIIFQMKLGLAD